MSSPRFWPKAKNPVELPAEMLHEIERLGLSREMFEWIAGEEDISFAQFSLERRGRAALEFERLYPEAIAFAERQRFANPIPRVEQLEIVDQAISRILRKKVVESERVPCLGRFCAAVFSGPIHLLSFLKSSWPNEYANPIFMTCEEATRWAEQLWADNSGNDRGWYVNQYWKATPYPDPDEDSFFEMDLDIPDTAIPMLIRSGHQWCSLAGGEDIELWYIWPNGQTESQGQVGMVQF